MKLKIPPFKINNAILQLSDKIFYEIGVLDGAKLTIVPIKLRRNNKIKTIHSSLAIEGNSLSLEQVTDILNGKKVLGKKSDIQEVRNAINIYDNLTKFNPTSIKNFKNAHKILMKDLICDNGEFRTQGVGIFKGDEVKHIAPPAKRVNSLIADLFKFIGEYDEISWLIKACIVHYEIEFIHPFLDGNGRIGRLWQQLLLMQENPIFEYIAVEALIRQNQQKYYDILGQCDNDGESTKFIEFSLEQVLKVLKQHNKSTLSQVNDFDSRIEYAKNHIGNIWFSRKDYINLHKDISSSTASRDLIAAVKNKILKKRGSKNQVEYSFQ